MTAALTSPAFWFALAGLAAAFAVTMAVRTPPRPGRRHAARPRRPAPAHARRLPADPRDAWLTLLRTDNGYQPAPADPRPHVHHEARTPAGAPLGALPPPAAVTREPPPDLAAPSAWAPSPSLAGLIAALPAAAPAPDPAPAETVPLPAAVCEYGLPASNDAWVEELFARAAAEIGVLAAPGSGEAAA